MSQTLHNQETATVSRLNTVIEKAKKVGQKVKEAKSTLVGAGVVVGALAVVGAQKAYAAYTVYNTTIDGDMKF